MKIESEFEEFFNLIQNCPNVTFHAQNVLVGNACTNYGEL